MAAIAFAGSSAHAPARAMRYVATTSSDWNSASAHWREVPGLVRRVSPFQHFHWLDSWYATIGRVQGAQPVVVEVREAASAAPVALFPLVLFQRGHLRVIAFSDAELTDYNAPLLTRALGAEPLRSDMFWKTVVEALPPADLLELRKMPFVTGRNSGCDGVAIPDSGTCAVTSNVVAPGDDWEKYRWGLGKPVRNELGRCWRLLEKVPGLTFERIRDCEEALRILDEMDAQQRQRMTKLEREFVLDQPGPHAFYRDLIRRGLGSGFAVMTAIRTPDTVVGALLGIVEGERYVVFRISNAGPEWSRYSPGRVALFKTMESLYGEGVRLFDFSIGEYAYKRRLGAKASPLVDLVKPLSVRGYPAAIRARAVMALRDRPALDARLRRLTGKAHPGVAASE